MTNPNNIAHDLNVTASEVRKYARKHFTKTDKVWNFTEEQIKELFNHFDPEQKMRRSRTPDTPATQATDLIPGLTEGESKVINWLIEKGWYTPAEFFSDVSAEEVAGGLGISIKSVRGYIGSLVKKEYIQLTDAEDDIPPIIYWGDSLEVNEETNKVQLKA